MWRAPGSVYQPAKRGLSWLKLKKDYLEGLADSIDVVPIGAWQGQGRKVSRQRDIVATLWQHPAQPGQAVVQCCAMLCSVVQCCAMRSRFAWEWQLMGVKLSH